MPEENLAMLVIHPRNEPGKFYLALVPAALDGEQAAAAFRELDIDAEAVFQLGGWRTSSQGVAVAAVPMPE